MKSKSASAITTEGGRGFTLVEVLAAVLLLSIGLLAVLTASGAARDAQRRAVYLSIGRNIAQSKIEELRSSLYTNPIPGSPVVTSSSSLPVGNTITVSVSPYPNATETNLYQARADVAWPEARGTRKVSYETLIVRE